MKGRTLTAALAAAAAVAAILVLALGRGSNGTALDPVAQAAQTTARAGGARMTFTGTVSVPGVSAPITIAGSGYVNFGAFEGEMWLSMAGLPPSAASRLPGGTLQMTEIFKSATLYIGSPLFDGKLPGGAHWTKLDLARVDQALGLDPSSFTSGGSNPAQYLRYLSAAGATTSIAGHERVRGVPTTHYVGTLDLLKAAAAQPGADQAKLKAALGRLASQTGAAAVPIGVWIDGQGRVRRLSLTLAEQTSGQQVAVAVACEYFDFGPTPTVNPPSGSEVFDLTERTVQGLSSTG